MVEEVSEIEKQRLAYERELSEWEQARKWATKSIPLNYLPPNIARKVRAIHRREGEIQEGIIRKNIADLEKQRELEKLKPPEQISTREEKLTPFEEIIKPPETKLTPYLKGIKPPERQITIPETERRTLPYQERATSFYDPTKGYYVSEEIVEKPEKIPTFTGFTKSIIEFPAGKIQRQVEETFMPEKKTFEERQFFGGTIYTPYPKRETIQSVPKYTELKSSEEIEIERKVIEFEKEKEIIKVLEELQSKEQDKLNKKVKDFAKSTSISQEELEKFIEEETRKTNERLTKEQEGVIKKYEEGYIEREKKRLKKLQEVEFVEGFGARRAGEVARASLYGIPVYGSALLISDVSGVAKEVGSLAYFGGSRLIGKKPKEPEILTAFKESPKQFAIETGASLGTFIIAGAGISRIKARVRKPKIEESVRLAKREVEILEGKVTEKSLALVKLDPKLKTELIDYLQKGHEVRKLRIYIKPKKGLEGTTPEVSGIVYEVVTRSGDLAERISAGKIKATYKGKKLESDLLAKSILKLEEGGKVKGYTEMLERVQKKGRIRTKDKVILSKYLEETQLIKAREKKGYRYTEAETMTSLLGKGKYKGEPLLEGLGERKGVIVYPDFAKLKGTPYTKTIAGELLRETRTAGLEATKGKKKIFAGIREYSVEKGGSISRRIIEEQPVKKPMKPFKTPTVKVKEIKAEKPKISEFTEQIIERPKPAYVGGEGGLASMDLIYAGKSFKVPYAGETLITGFTERLGTTFTKPSMALPIKTGLAGGLTISERQIQPTTLNLRTMPLQIEKTIEKTKEKERERERLTDASKLGQVPVQISSFSLGLREVQVEKQALKQELKFRGGVALMPPVIPAIPIKYPEEVKFNLRFPRKKKPTVEDRQGYDAYTYLEATKPKKSRWIKLNTKALTKKSALALSSREVDNTISARGKVAKSAFKGKPVDTNDNYFEINRFKFRTFKQKKGVRQKLPNSFIEKQSFRLDKPQEILQLQKGRRRTPLGF